MQRTVAILTTFAIGLAQPLLAQDVPRPANIAGLSLAETAKQLNWNDPTEPMKVVGPIHFVGTRGLSSWLIDTTDGHILLNTGMPPSGALIEASIRKLGHKPEDVKLLLTCHAHVDHVGGLAYLKRATGAQVVAMDSEVELLQSGGKTDFNYGSVAEFQFEPVRVDHVIRDGEKVTLGDVTLVALKTAGHTRGSTTWVTRLTNGTQSYTVVFPDGTSVNPGYRLVKHPSYPGIADDYPRTFQTLAALEPDIWLTPHTEPFAFDAKRARAATEGVNAWVDPEGYRNWVEVQRKKFEAAAAKESARERTDPTAQRAVTVR